MSTFKDVLDDMRETKWYITKFGGIRSTGCYACPLAYFFNTGNLHPFPDLEDCSSQAVIAAADNHISNLNGPILKGLRAKLLEAAGLPPEVGG